MYVTLKPDARYEEPEVVAPGVVLDFDKDGNVIALEIYEGARKWISPSWRLKGFSQRRERAGAGRAVISEAPDIPGYKTAQQACPRRPGRAPRPWPPARRPRSRLLPLFGRFL